MKILDFLDSSSIILDLKAKDKKHAIMEMVDLLYKLKKVKNPDKIVQVVMEREKIGTTGIGQGIAIPHGRTNAVDKLLGVLAVSRIGVEFEALDGEKVKLLFLILSPPDAVTQHLRAISSVANFFKDRFVCQALYDAKSVEEIVEIIKKEEESRP